MSIITTRRENRTSVGGRGYAQAPRMKVLRRAASTQRQWLNHSELGLKAYVPCPDCKQPEGSYCLTGSGKTMKTIHVSRARIGRRYAVEMAEWARVRGHVN